MVPASIDRRGKAVVIKKLLGWSDEEHKGIADRNRVGLRTLCKLGHQYGCARSNQSVIDHVVVLIELPRLYFSNEFVVDEYKRIILVSNHTHGILLLRFESPNIKLATPAWDRRLHFEQLIAVGNIDRNLRTAMPSKYRKGFCGSDQCSGQIAPLARVRASMDHIGL